MQWFRWRISDIIIQRRKRRNLFREVRKQILKAMFLKMQESEVRKSCSRVRISIIFLGAKAVKNDFTIKDDNYYIITGANMAGKSTFLRSLGVNYILAMAGMPVFADQLKISRFRLFSSMRTTDDLTHGISYFNAELIRLEELLKFCKESAEGMFCKESAEGNKEPLRTLIILDEILKGTNSLDKLNGSRKFLEAIAKQPVSGIIATHDLELSKMENDASGKFHNYCFEIDLGTDVTYTYKIQKGVARNQNATFLLNKILEKY